MAWAPSAEGAHAAMRRKPGIAGLQKGLQHRDKFKALGSEVAETRLEHMRASLAAFKDKLEEFALKHREDVRRDPVFRAQFHQMCANVGVDPLASNKGTWAQLLKFGDFYYELGVQVAEACLATRPYNGGLLGLDTLRSLVLRRRGSRADPVSEDDILRAIEKLQVLGGGWSVTKVGSQRLVRSVPGQLSTDTNAVLELVQGRGHTSKQQLAEATQWAEERCVEALWALLKEGLALVDDQGPQGQRLYWFPCITGPQGGQGQAPLLDEGPAGVG